MSRTTTSIAMTVAAFSLVLGLAACGTSSGSDSDKKTTTTEASGGNQQGSTTTADDKTTTTEEDATTTVVATGGGDFCQDLADYINESSTMDVDVTDKDAYKDAIEESTDKAKDLAKKAPGKVKDELNVLLDAQDELLGELEKVDFDYTKLPADALSVMSSSEVQAASEKLDSYASDTCGIDLSTPEVSAPEMPDVTAATIPSN